MPVLNHAAVDRATIYQIAGEPVFQIGRFSYIGSAHYGLIDTTCRFVIGSFSAISFDVHLMSKTNHHPEWHTIYPLEQMPWHGSAPRPVNPHAALRDNITIGSDVWIGESVRILPGRTIADGAVVGAGAVVAHDVRPYAVVAGNPAREVKRRFDDATIEVLLELRWWELPTDQIRQLSPYLCSKDTEGLKREAARLAAQAG